jgi:hypothetical protein
VANVKMGLLVLFAFGQLALYILFGPLPGDGGNATPQQTVVGIVVFLGASVMLLLLRKDDCPDHKDNYACSCRSAS